METSRYHPNEVAHRLQVSPSTLRRWSNEFSDFLSGTGGHPPPSAGGQSSHRRYTDTDIETLRTVKELLAEGLTYIRVCQRLEALRLWKRQVEDGELPTPLAVSPSGRDLMPAAPAAIVLADALRAVADGQHLLMGSQKANRDLLTVVLQDNFNLKEENAKLRDRMLVMERDIAEIKRRENLRRENTEARLAQLEARLRQRGQAKANDRPGCLSQLLGPLA